MKNDSLFRSLSFAVFVLLFLGVSLSGRESHRVASARPASVPQNYAITPFGYFHPSCVRSLADDDTLFSDGRVQRANGAIDPKVAVCSYPHYPPTGVPVIGDAKELTGANLAQAGESTITGWLEYISATTNTSYRELSATWTVPQSPTNNEGQVLFFFPGFQDYNNSLSIVQPVLQWGRAASGGGPYWAIASWNCCISGTTFFSHLRRVSTGDAILGTIAPMCKSPKKIQSCTIWKIVTADVTSGKNSTLRQNPADGQVWNWGFGAVAEVYGVRQCDDFPADAGVTFSTELYDNNGVRISDPGWTVSPADGSVTPQCNYGLSFTNTEQTLQY